MWTPVHVPGFPVTAKQKKGDKVSKDKGEEAVGVLDTLQEGRGGGRQLLPPMQGKMYISVYLDYKILPKSTSWEGFGEIDYKLILLNQYHPGQ